MLIEKIRQDRMMAMKSRDDKKKNLLGVLIADACKDVKQPDDASVIRFVKKFIDNARENLGMLEKGGGSATAREDARREIDTLTEYLPSQLTGDSLAKAISALMAHESIEPLPASMGKVMKALGTHYAGKYDGKEASELVRSILSGKK